MKSFHDKRIIFLYIVTIIAIIIFIVIAYTYSTKFDNLAKSFSSEIILIDEAAYGKTNFDSSNLDLIPILDKNIETNNNNVIKIEFNIGGSKKSNINNIVYDIALVDLKLNCELLSPYVKWKLIKNQTETYEGSLDYKFDTINNGRLVLTPIQQNLKEYNEDKNTYDHYEFYLWLSDSCQEEDLTKCINIAEDQSNLLNKKISGKIEVELYKESKKELVRTPSEVLDLKNCMKENGENNEN